MSAPVHLFIILVRNLLLMGSCICSLGLLISKGYIFYSAYSEFSLQRAEEAWLREKCREPDFYSNMRQHTDLCAKVERNARSVSPCNPHGTHVCVHLE